MERRTHFIDNNKLEDMSYAQLLKEGHKAGESDHGTKLIGISGGAVSAVTGTLAIIGEEFGEELLSKLILELIACLKFCDLIIASLPKSHLTFDVIL